MGYVQTPDEPERARIVSVSEQRTYANAPITEAIIDLQVIPAKVIEAERFADFHEGIVAQFPEREALLRAQVSIQMGAGAVAEQALIGYQFSDGQKQRSLQAGPERFSYHLLAKYENWDVFSGEARALWSKYVAFSGPLTIARVAVRFINRLDLPGPSIELKDYLRTYAEISPDLQMQPLSGFFMQLQLPQGDLSGMLVINQALVPPAAADVVSLVLDFDLFCEGKWDKETDAWALLDQLRNRKNDAFEACITEKTRELIS
jgi:uncharacterized protein (TIGR04255 family)